MQVRRYRSGLLFLAAALLASSAAWAQETERGPDGSTSTHVSGVEVLNIPGKPFSAHSSMDWTRRLEDGSTITQHLDALLARDSQGRVYREKHHFVPANSHTPAPLYELHIYDPVARAQMFWVARALTCFITSYQPRTFAPAPQPGTSRDGTRTLNRETLGSDTIEGLFEVHTRETVTTEADATGNSQPLTSTREYWYSEELQTNLAVTRMDPRTGRQEIHLSQVARGEPDPHIFEVPVGFHVRDTRSNPARAR